ncbi:MAG: DUF5610 domain-containing protein [Amphritea sp.]|nr:DUF5610 domain-containing protein [Amphritea sp.]
MDIQPLNPAAQTSKAETDQVTNKQATVPELQTDPKAEQNRAILESSLQVSLQSGNQSLALLYRTAVEELNKVLETDLGANAIQNAYDSGLDVSPEATAERIVSQTTAFFSAYQEQNPGLSLEEQVTRFTDIIGGGIDQGFSEAREILDGLNVLEGDIAANIDTSYDLVQEKLTAFADRILGNDNVTAEDTVAPDQNA